MSESSPYASEPLPLSPTPPVVAAAATPGMPPVLPPVYEMEPGDTTQGILRGAIGIVLAAAGILAQLFGAGALGSEGFPSNAPVESAMNFGLTLVLVGAGIALVILGVRASKPRRMRPERPVSILAIVGGALVLLALLSFLLLSGPAWISVLSGVRGRYDGLVGGIFLAGLPWTVGTVFAATALRSSTIPSRLIAWLCVGVGVLLTVPVVAAAALYSAGITD